MGCSTAQGHREPTAHALAGVAVPMILWLVLVPWAPRSAAGWGRALVMIGAVVLVSAVVGGASAFVDRAAGRHFVAAAFLTAMSLFMRLVARGDDPLWPMAALLFLLVALGAFVVALALGRLVRGGSPMA